jgi:hypothetical protein
MTGHMSLEGHGPSWMTRAAWTVAVIFTAAPLFSIVHQPVGWGPRILVTALTITAAARPFDALLLLAGLSPFAATILALTRAGSVPLNFFEATVLAFLLGWAMHRAIRPQRLALSQRFAVAAVFLFALTLAALITSAIIIRVEHPDTPARELLQSFVLRGYLVGSNTLTSGMLILEGIALMVAAAEACAGDAARRRRVLAIMVIAAAAAAFLNVSRIFNSAIAQPHPLTTFFAQLATVRVNMHFPDLNAAGSYFALMLFVALGMVPVMPILGPAASVAIATGIWVAGSRTAMAAVLGSAGVVALVRPLDRRRQVVWSFAIIIGLAAIITASWRWYPAGRNLDSGGALSYRISAAKAAFDVIRAHAIFGIRPGNFPVLSGFANNAHNNYLQIAAELGVPALVCFLYISGFAIRASWREATESWPAWGLSLGLIAYLITCLAGHPMLVPGAAYPFWIALGLAASCGARPLSRAPVRWAGVAAVAIVAATMPFQISAAMVEADVEHSSVGFSRWQQQSDGSRYRWAGGHATFFVSPAARSIRIPLRSAPTAPAAIEVTIYLDGVEANRVILRTEDGEKTVRLNLLRAAKTRFARIDLESRVPGASRPLDVQATDAGGVLMVGRPIPES